MEDWTDTFNFKESDINVLNIINQEDLTSFTFEGLKRRSKIRHN